MDLIKLRNDSWLSTAELPQELLDIDFDEMWEKHPEQYAQVKIAGKLINTPRWSQSYGKGYMYSGVEHDGIEVDPIFQPILEWANTLGYGNFDQLLVNWYENGLHYIGAHSDAEGDLVKGSAIVSISYGTERKFRIRNKQTKEILLDVPLVNGSVVVMGGKFQKELTHEVPKIGGKKGLATGRRINITLRQFKV